MRSLCAILLLFLPWICSAQCTRAVAVLRVKIEASESDQQHLLKDLKEHGCKHGLAFQLTDEGFDYRIALSDTLKPRMTLTQAGIGSAEDAVLLTTVFDEKRTVLFEFDREKRLTRGWDLNISAKEIVKRLVRVRSKPPVGAPHLQERGYSGRGRANCRQERAAMRTCGDEREVWIRVLADRMTKSPALAIFRPSEAQHSTEISTSWISVDA